LVPESKPWKNREILEFERRKDRRSCGPVVSPFSVLIFVKVLPSTVKKITVLDRTKEQGSAGEPLLPRCCNSHF
jgi:hypothetical protein